MLLSDTSWAYTEAAAALQADWRPSARGRELVVLNSRSIPDGVPPAALVTLGSSALRAAMEHVEAHPDWAHVPVLSALLPREGFTGVWRRPPAWVSAAYLDQPFERYLDLIRRAFPGLTRVGVLLGAEGAASAPAWIKAASDRGLQLVPGTVTRPDNLYPTLRTVLADSDVLLVLPDSTVADATALQNMLITAYRKRVPVVTYSPALVKAGAALGLYASPAQVGRQVAGMLKAPINGQSWPVSRLAEGFTVAINEQVCRSLGLTVPDVTELTDAVRRQEGSR
ncbi:MAG: ABC transporter substrate-binding protein [Acidobacteriota bacterium]